MLQKYRATEDYASLQLLAGRLKTGMSRKQTEALLRSPGHSPTDGVYMYSSDRKEFLAEARAEMRVYLVLYFTDSEDKVTDKLQEWGFEPLGE